MASVNVRAPFSTIPIFYNLTLDSVTPQRVAGPAVVSQCRSLRILNCNSVKVVAWTLVKQGVAAPTMTASAPDSIGTNDKTKIFALGSQIVDLWGGFDLLLIGSASTTFCSVTEFDEALGST